MHFMFKSIVFLLKQTLKTMKNLQSQSLTIYNLSNPAFCEAQ